MLCVLYSVDSTASQ